MPGLDDEGFEAYLKRFRPANPGAMQRTIAEGRVIRPFAGVAWLAAIAAVLVASILIFHDRTPRDHERVSIVHQSASEPLTIRTANSWLAAAPSFKAALDDLAFDTRSSTIPANKRSAIAVLGQENTSL